MAKDNIREFKASFKEFVKKKKTKSIINRVWWSYLVIGILAVIWGIVAIGVQAGTTTLLQRSYNLTTDFSIDDGGGGIAPVLTSYGSVYLNYNAGAILIIFGLMCMIPVIFYKWHFRQIIRNFSTARWAIIFAVGAAGVPFFLGLAGVTNIWMLLFCGGMVVGVCIIGAMNEQHTRQTKKPKRALLDRDDKMTHYYTIHTSGAWLITIGGLVLVFLLAAVYITYFAYNADSWATVLLTTDIIGVFASACGAGFILFLYHIAYIWIDKRMPLMLPALWDSMPWLFRPDVYDIITLVLIALGVFLATSWEIIDTWVNLV